MMSRAKQLLERVEAVNMDEAVRNGKKKIRETLLKMKEEGSRGMRILGEVMKERGELMQDEQNDEAPNAKSDTDKKMLNEVMGDLKKDLPKLKKMKEVLVGLSTQTRPPDKKGDLNKPDPGKQDPAFKGSKEDDIKD